MRRGRRDRTLHRYPPTAASANRPAMAGRLRDAPSLANSRSENSPSSHGRTVTSRYEDRILPDTHQHFIAPGKKLYLHHPTPILHTILHHVSVYPSVSYNKGVGSVGSFYAFSGKFSALLVLIAELRSLCSPILCHTNWRGIRNLRIAKREREEGNSYQFLNFPDSFKS